MDNPAGLWWLWLVVGLALFAGEQFVPTGLYLLFFGVSAALVGLIGFVGLVTDLPLQLLLFAVFSLVSLVAFRGGLAARLHSGGTTGLAELVGETAVALGPVSTNAVGSAELRGAIWRMRNVGKFDVAEGQRCRVEQVDGLELWVRGV
jgi:membrane protein implicated in regulation of membrane protease activity